MSRLCAAPPFLVLLCSGRAIPPKDIGRAGYIALPEPARRMGPARYPWHEKGTGTVEHIDHVLVVDDDREIREMVSGYLRKNGLRVSLAADGRQMRSFLEADRVDLVVLDIMMPGDDGLVLCRSCGRAGTGRRRC